MSTSRYRVGASADRLQANRSNGNSNSTGGVSPSNAAAARGNNNNNASTTNAATNNGSVSPRAGRRASAVGQQEEPGLSPLTQRSNSRRRRSSRGNADWDKKSTEASTLSFTPDALCARRRMMCARRSEIGAEKVICPKGVLDSEPSVTATLYDTISVAVDDAASPPRQYAAVNPVDAPSPLDRVLRMSAMKSPSKHAGGGGSRSPPKRSADTIELDDDEEEIVDDDDEEEQQQHDNGAAGYEELLHSFPLPDWRVLAGKELYARERQELEIIRERYSVATDPKPEKKGGRRRSSITAPGTLGSSVRK